MNKTLKIKGKLKDNFWNIKFSIKNPMHSDHWFANGAVVEFYSDVKIYGNGEVRDLYFLIIYKCVLYI